MDERVVKFRVGVMVLATLIIGGILVLLFSDASSLASGSYTLYIHFTDAPGVTEGTPVRKSGILIGRVTSVRFAEQGGVLVAIKVNRGVEIHRNEVPQVSGSLLGGDVVIQFVRRSDGLPAQPRAPAESSPSDKQATGGGTPPAMLISLAGQPADGQPGKEQVPAESPDNVVQPGEYIEGTVAPNVLQVVSGLEGDLKQAIGALGNAGNDVSKLANRINDLLGENGDKINRIVDKTEGTLDSLQKALGNVDDLLGDQEVRGNLKKMINDLPELVSDTRSTITTIRTTVEGVDRNLRNLEGLTGPLGERGEHIVTNVDQAVARLDELLGEFSDFAKKLNQGQGSLGQLMRNPDLYQNLNSAARNIEQITRELRPIVADARVFSDKIARHPELLGVRGAIQRSPGTK